MNSIYARTVFIVMCLWIGAPAHSEDASTGGPPAFVFKDVSYTHRWSRNGQHEFLPVDGRRDLKTWTEMVTVNVYDSVDTGDKLAAIANGVVTNYQRAGKILGTRSKPRTSQAQAEHFIAALLGNQNLVEAVFARCMLVDGKGVVVVYSRRAYGTGAGQTVGSWMADNGAAYEAALMSWKDIPTASALRSIPDSKD